jgi:hypothetical protein
MPYPAANQSTQTILPAPASQNVQTFFLAENTSQTGVTVPAASGLKTDPKSNEKISKKLILP